MIPAWAGAYVGLPYLDKGRTRDGVDCWGVVRLALGEVAGIALPDYGDAYTGACDRFSASGAITAGLAHNWQRVEAP